MKKIAVILSGCGNRDGSELQETLGLLLAIDRHNMIYQCFAPCIDFDVVSYLDNSGETGEVRDLYAEAARIARGNIKPISDYHASDYDALAFPGGMGAARNLSTFAFDGPQMTVIDGVTDAIIETFRAKKPILAMCIAPTVVAKVLGKYGVSITLGAVDNAASQVAKGFGCNMVACGPTDVCVDEEHRILTTPAYMVATHISEIFDGAANMVAKLSEWL